MSGGIGAKLTDRAIKAFVAKAQPGKKLADGGGLHLFITPAGGTTWRIKYRIDGKEKIYSIGPYPEISLAAARVELTEVKALLRENKDPVTQRRINRAETSASSDNTFEAVACEWLSMKNKEWSAGHYTKSSRALERDIYPIIHNDFRYISCLIIFLSLCEISADNRKFRYGAAIRRTAATLDKPLSDLSNQHRSISAHAKEGVVKAKR